MTFTKWLNIVDGVLFSKTGMDSAGLPDWGWHDAYDAGISPLDAADTCFAEVLRDNGLG